MLCVSLKLDATLGVHEKNQIRSQKGEDKGYFVDYQKIWLENGGKLVKINNHIYIMNFLTSEKILKKFQAASVQCIKNALPYLKKSNKL